MSADPWSAFGDEDTDDSEDKAAHNAGEIQAVVSHLAQRLLKWDASVSLSQRYVGIVTRVCTTKCHESDAATSDQWREALSLKQMSNVVEFTEDELNLNGQACASIPSHNGQNETRQTPALEATLDAVIWCIPSLQTGPDASNDASPSPDPVIRDHVPTMLVSGGLFLYQQSHTPNGTDALFTNESPPEVSWWYVDSIETIPANRTTHASPPSLVWNSIVKWPCQIATETCPWLSNNHSNVKERRKLALATVALSVHERTTPPLPTRGPDDGTSKDTAPLSVSEHLKVTLSPNSIRAAVSSMQTHGYCLVSGLLSADREQCLVYGQAVLDDLHAAAVRLKREGIDLYHPLDGTKEPDTYRELSMREDCRMDVRFGPALHALRGHSANHPVTLRASNVGLPRDFLRGNPNLLSIVRNVMNPVQSSQLSAGNFGRYNFDGGGPDGSFQPLTAGIVGGIVSLPGSADQAIHADTPHLFEHIANPPLPAHYINVFTPGCPAVDRVGQTAFVHGSHQLDFVAQYCQKNSNKALEPFHSSIWEHLVRPRLDVGDVLLFDCRILHFGLANQHDSVERPLLYANMTMHWFHDPKNWEQQRRIFDDDVGTE